MAELISSLTPCLSSILSSVWMARSRPARSEACAMRVDNWWAVSIAVIIFIRLVFWIHIYYRRSDVNRLQTVERSGSNGRVRFPLRPDIALRYTLTVKANP